MRGRNKEVDPENEPYLNLDRQFKQSHRASIGRKVTARPSVELLQKARTPAELLKLRLPSLKDGDSGIEFTTGGTSATGADTEQASSESSHHHGHRLTYHDLLRWLQKEKARRTTSKTRKRLEKRAKEQDQTAASVAPSGDAAVPIIEPENVKGESSRRPSNASSEGSIALEMLREMLEHQMSKHERHPSRILRNNLSVRSFKKLRRLSTAASSDTEFNDGDISVPTCDVFLDNSKTSSYSGGTVVDNDSRPYLMRTVSTREREAWKMFKIEIIKIAHTLRLKGWRRVPLDRPDTISVERLSGALTNAVYVVSPPKNLTEIDDDYDRPQKSKPRKLLLRIYGSQVDHLIDRESELQILRRLSKKKIGPRLLGTFLNGRFEEFVNARALSPDDLRIPDISRLIAKRVRELHDGIELLNSEIQAGPFVWQNINKWMARAEEIVCSLETLVKDESDVLNKLSVKERFVGSDFALFKQALQKYQVWLEQIYKGKEGIKERLVFAHNDV
jgi:choline kinase